MKEAPLYAFHDTRTLHRAEAAHSCNPMKAVPHKAQARTNTNQPMKKTFGRAIQLLAG